MVTPMRVLKHSLLMMLCLAIAVTGFPVAASVKSQCPMMAKMEQMSSVQDMQKGKPCEHCTKMGNQEQKKGGCCGDPACAAKCLSMSNASNAYVGTQAAPFSFAISTTERLYSSDHVLASHLLQTQDRPPKHLS